MGWTGDAQVYVPASTLNADIQRFFEMPNEIIYTAKAAPPLSLPGVCIRARRLRRQMSGSVFRSFPDGLSVIVRVAASTI